MMINSDNNDNTSVTNVFVEKDVTVSGTAAWTGFVNANNCNAGIFFDGNGIAQRFSTTLPHDVTGSVRNRFYFKTTNGPTALHETYNGTVAQFTINGSCGASPPSGYERWPTSGSLLKTFTINNTAGVTLRGNRNINDIEINSRPSPYLILLSQAQIRTNKTGSECKWRNIR